MSHMIPSQYYHCVRPILTGKHSEIERWYVHSFNWRWRKWMIWARVTVQVGHVRSILNGENFSTFSLNCIFTVFRYMTFCRACLCHTSPVLSACLIKPRRFARRLTLCRYVTLSQTAEINSSDRFMLVFS